MYKYWAAGLHIESAIEFPELFPLDFNGQPDLSITIGTVPEQLTGEGLVQGMNVFLSPREYLLLLPVAKYYAAGGSQIVVEPVKGADKKSVRLFLLSNVLAAVLHQRNKVLLHASGISYEDGAFLFTGPSGVGKSTLLTSLHARGFQVFSDDICVLNRPDSSGVFSVTPTYPMIKLWEHSFDILGMKIGEEHPMIREEISKHALFYHDKFLRLEIPVKKIFVLQPQKDAAVSVVKLSKMEAFEALQYNTYRPMQTNAMQKRKVHFEQLLGLVSSAVVFRVTRPDDSNTINDLSDLLELHITQDGKSTS